MRKPGGIKATPVLVNKVADPIGEDEGKRWKESTEVKPSLTLVLGMTCFWRLMWVCRRAGSSLLSSSPFLQMLNTC